MIQNGATHLSFPTLFRAWYMYRLPADLTLLVRACIGHDTPRMLIRTCLLHGWLGLSLSTKQRNMAITHESKRTVASAP